MQDIIRYPLDTKLLLRKKKALRAELLARPTQWLDKNIALLGGSTTAELADQLELFLLAHGIRPNIYQSEFGQYWQDAMFGNEALTACPPDIVLIHTTWRNIPRFADIHAAPADTAALLDAEFGRWTQMWQAAAARWGCPIIQNNFDRPDYRLLGNRDIWDHRGRSAFINQLNQRLYAYARAHAQFYINDIDYLAQETGLAAWNDPIYWHMYKYACCLDGIVRIAFSAANIIKALYGKNKKALVLDLDNTLWGGVVGDDGPEHLALGPETPKGAVFSAFQQYCKELKDMGVVLGINSKNDEANARAGLAHPDSVLHAEDFACIKANWEPKDRNLRAMAQELCLGADSFVFVDDNPAERALVQAGMPDAAVPDPGTPEQYVRVLDHLGYFEAAGLSAEDLARADQYRARAQAAAQQDSFVDYGQYLDSLQMEARFTGFAPVYVQRIAQLTNKSNQFNLTTLRCTEGDIQRMAADPAYVCLAGRLADKFADNGIVTVAAAQQQGDALHIRLWLMSCRVLKRGLEDAVRTALLRAARERGVRELVGYYYPTPQNGMVQNLYASLGFAAAGATDNGGTVWRLAVADAADSPLHMRVTYSTGEDNA